MSEKRLDFISAYEKIVYDLRKESGKLIQKNYISCELVNLQTREIDKLKKENEQLKQKLENLDLKEENEQLKKQIQIYEQLISNSYVGEEETLDGFVGKYVIWEDELQEYKNKNEMIGDE